MSELKCPFCQQELREIYFNGVGVGYICPNPDCKKAEKLKGNTELWQELIRTRKALETAKDTLHWYDDNYDSVVARNTLDEIKTALEQKDK